MCTMYLWRPRGSKLVREMMKVDAAKIALGLMLLFQVAGAVWGEVTIKVYGLPDVTSPSME